MNKFPKIYSLSTAGVRQHNNADYMLHGVRTDFTGDNGLGKSIIADLMQLIFIPKRDMWKPGTEGVGKNDRKIEGIPLNKEYVQHAYTFMNIERYQNRFITIGVYIPKNSRLPVRPFIIQKGDDFDGKTLISFDQPLKSSDFLSEDKHVLDLRELKQHLHTKYNVHLKDFFKSEEINLYYDLLYRNQLIPIDLTKEANLKAFAKILQSFSRAKTLDINNSRSLQNFLFDDNDAIKHLFDEQKDLLVSYIRQYNSNRSIIGDLQLKQTKLLSLKKIQDKLNEAKIEFYKGDASFAAVRLRDSQRHNVENKQRLESALKNYQRSSAEAKKLAQDILTNYFELRSISILLKKNYKELLPQFSDEKIEKKRDVANELWAIVNELDKVAVFYKKYKTVQNIQTKLKEQALIKEQKRRLFPLLNIANFEDFENSKWTINYKKAYEHYQERLVELPQTIAQLKNTLELYDNEKADSLISWTIAQKKALSLGEETVVMHLKDVTTKKPKTAEAGFKYTLSPKELLSSFKDDKGGVWLQLGELHEFIPYVTKQKFNNAKTLKNALEKDKEEIKKNLVSAQQELEVISKLNLQLSEIGFNSEVLEIYKDRDNITSYEIDEDLNDSVIPIIEANIENLDKYDELKAQYKEANEQSTLFAKRQTELNIELEQTSADLIELDEKIEFLKKETRSTVQFDDSHLKKLTVEEMKSSRDEITKDIIRHLTEKDNAERYSITSEGIVASCREREKQINAELEKHTADFEEKKRTLEIETDLKFEELLQMGGYTENTIRKLEYAYNDARRGYEEDFTRIAQSFDETKDNKNPELENEKFNFYTLVKILCGKMGLEGLAPELEKLNEELKKFGDLQLAIIVNVFAQVEKQFNGLKRLITELNFFFQDNKISTGYAFRIDFNERKDIDISWISKMRERARTQHFGADLFTEVDGINSNDNSPDKLITSIAQTFSSVKNCELEDLLNPKFYFELRVGLYDDKGNRYSGSGGQAYTALALLCIGRLSVIQREKDRPGVRFIIIEELSNIDDTNFNLFPQIAEQFGYQLLTMTPKPFGTYSEDSWFLHMLVRGKDKDINYQPMSFFKTKNSKKVLQEYLTETPN